MRCPHTSFIPGRRVRVRLVDGTVFVAKYVEYRSNFVVLRHIDTNEEFRLRKPLIRVMSYYREQPHQGAA